MADIVAIVCGPFVGSFIALAAIRWPEGRPWVLGRSQCPDCGVVLGVRSLVPILSWLWQGGRCRSCGTRISPFYPAVEIAALVVPLWAASVLDGWLLWLTAGLGWTLLLLAVIDWRSYRLPDSLTLALIPAGLAATWAIDPEALADHAIGVVAGFAAFALIALLYRRLRGREGLGLGDAKLLAGCGAWVGWQGLPGVVLWGCAAGLAVALVEGVAKRDFAGDRRIAFGPYLCLGFWLVWLYGPLGFG